MATDWLLRETEAYSLTNGRIAEEALIALRRHVIEPLTSRCVDNEYGGFLVDFDERWRPAGPQDKTLEHASRMTSAFALMARALPGEGYDQLVRHGCAFLKDVMWDAQHTGFFVKVDRNGRPFWDGLKHPHAVTYATEAFLLAQPFLAPGEGRSWAHRAISWLNDVAWDTQHGGYWGSYRRSNERYPDKAFLPTPDGRDVLHNTPGFKELNTLGDAIEMLTVCVEHDLADGCAARLEWLVNLLIDRLSDEGGILSYLYRRDWKPVPDVVHVGLQFQMVHRLVAAAAVTGACEPVTRSRELCDFLLASARHPSGGFCYAVTADGRTWPATGPSTDVRQWWVQLEAVRALHVLAVHEAFDSDARAAYGRRRDEQWQFVRENFFDEKFGGIREVPIEPNLQWRSRLRRWLRRSGASKPHKTHGWKDAIHEVGTFLTLAGLIRHADIERRVMTASR